MIVVIYSNEPLVYAVVGELFAQGGRSTSHLLEFQLRD